MSESPPSTPKATSGLASLTPREGEILAKAWSCLKTGPPEIDYEKLAGEMGMTNPRSAANAWGAIKKKMSWNTAAAAATPGAATPKSAAKRKKPAASKAANNNNNNKANGHGGDDEAEDNDADADEATPAKKAKASRTKRAPAKAKAVAKGSDEDGQAEASAPDVKKVKAEPAVKAEAAHESDEGI